MAVNQDKPHLWKEDIARSVDLYNHWFVRFAPKTFRAERAKATAEVEGMFERTQDLRNLTATELRSDPAILFALRMSTAPPIARDRLVGLAKVPKPLVSYMELKHRLPPRMSTAMVDINLGRIVRLIRRLADADIFPWLDRNRRPRPQERYRAATIVADRLCGANADPIVRNAQEKRQLRKIKSWLEKRSYRRMAGRASPDTMAPGTFAFRVNIPGSREDEKVVNIPVDSVVMPHSAKSGQLPLNDRSQVCWGLHKRQ